jgi:alanine racemase
MNRIGFDANAPESASLIYEGSKLAHLSFDGIFTHFACADETEGACSDMSDRQYASFMRLIDELKGMGLCFDTVHACNSAASVRYPAYNLDMIRLGIMLYGHSPFEDGYELDLRPVMRFVTSVTHVHTLKAGETISYGATYTAERDMKIATVAAGYADGFLRILGRGGMYIRGQYAPVVGRVCMDQCMLDVTYIDGVCVGDDAEIFDRDGKNIRELSRVADTISYELLCSVSKRVNRIERNEALS